MAVAVRSAPSSARSEESPDAGRLFAEHSDRLLAYCVRLLGSRAEAEDALQTTFLYAHRALERGVVPENEHAWLHAIARNACRWHLRTLARRGPLSTDLDLDAFPSRLPIEDESQDLREELEDALATIPESQRHAFVLREVHGLAASEVAARMGMSTQATYALLTRARRSMAQAISTSRRRPLFGIDLGTLAYKLKALFAGGTAKVVATAAAAGSIAIGGVVVEQAVNGPVPAPRPTPAVPSAGDAGEARGGVGAERVSSLGAGRDVRPTSQERSAGAPSAAESPPPADTSELPTVSAAVPPELQPASAGSAPATTPADAPEPARAGDPKPVTELAPELPAPEEELPPLVEDLLDPLLEDLPELPLPDLEEPLASTDDLLDPVLDGESDLDDVVDETLSDVDDAVSDLPLPDVELPLP